MLSQAPLQKRNDFFHKVITNPPLFAQIQLGSILIHSQIDFQEHSKVPERALLVGFSAGIMKKMLFCFQETNISGFGILTS